VGMRAVALHHTKMGGELAALRVVVSSTVESVLRRLPDETVWLELVGEQVAKFRRLEERCSRLGWPGMRIYDLLLRPPLDQA
jgi:hypothetical protein